MVASPHVTMDEETPSPALDRIGQTVAGRYELKRLLGEGGMGAVYDAEHAVTRRHVAVKLLHDGSRWDRGSVERFLREAQIAAAIRHPGIIDVLDAGTDASGAPFLVFEMLEGYSVADLLDTQPRPPVALTLGIAREMLDALAAAHAQRIYHRDIKPENVFLATDGRGQTVVKLLDFGISKAAENVGLGRHTQTRTGVLMGTPAYMSPEQVRGQSDVDARSDVWSVGVMLYEMLAGELPFRAENINALMFAIDRDPIAPLDVVAPGTPQDRVDYLRKAFDETMKDPALLEEAQKMSVEINPLNGTTVQSIFRDLFSRPEPMLQKARDYLGTK